MLAVRSGAGLCVVERIRVATDGAAAAAADSTGLLALQYAREKTPEAVFLAVLRALPASASRPIACAAGVQLPLAFALKRGYSAEAAAAIFEMHPGASSSLTSREVAMSATSVELARALLIAPARIDARIRAASRILARLLANRLFYREPIHSGFKVRALLVL